MTTQQRFCISTVNDMATWLAAALTLQDQSS